MSSFIVIGAGFGDEGKGLITDYLCSHLSKPLVVRFSGGHQAGHTVVLPDGKRHVFSNFGSGTLRNIPTYWSKFCTFDPAGILKEVEKLNSIDINPTIYIDNLCPVITPYDILYNRQKDAKENHGTCGIGFGATLEREENHYGLHVMDLFYPKVLEIKLNAIVDYYTSLGIAIPKAGITNINKEFLDYVNKLKSSKLFNLFTVNEKDFFDKTHLDSLDIDNFVFEGSQGILLDREFGFYPNVTRSNTTSKNAIHLIDKYGLDPTTTIYVSRAYQTRHGEGPMSFEEFPVVINENPNETNVTNQYQGNFKRTLLDIDLLQYAIHCDKQVNTSSDSIFALTCLDQVEKEMIWYRRDELTYGLVYNHFIKMLQNSLDIVTILISNSDCSENIKSIFNQILQCTNN